MTTGTIAASTERRWGWPSAERSTSAPSGIPSNSL
jgi:hypothetical protein